MRPGDRLTIFCGDGRDYHARLTEIDRRRMAVTIDTIEECDRESPLQITLAQSISRGERMDMVIQKGVEMGVQRFIPIRSERSAPLAGKAVTKRLEHWRSVAIAACEQCGRNRLPQISEPLALTDWLEKRAGSSEARRLLLDPFAGCPIGQVSPPDGQPGGEVWLLTGPEGGFSADENRNAVTAGYTPVRLGPRILRTESAAIASVAVVQTLWGDWR